MPDVPCILIVIYVEEDFWKRRTFSYFFTIDSQRKKKYSHEVNFYDSWIPDSS